MNTPGSILCVMDSSKAGGGALRYAIAKAKQQSAKLTVARVVVARDIDDAEFLIAPPAENGGTWWSPTEEAGVEIACEELCPSGDPAEEIVELARQLSVDHIVMGTSGRRRLHHLDMGRTARQVVRRAPCAVTVVSNEDVPQ